MHEGFSFAPFEDVQHIGRRCEMLVVGGHDDLPVKRVGYRFEKTAQAERVLVAQMLDGLIEKERAGKPGLVTLQESNAQG
jgi:hypothetical protein